MYYASPPQHGYPTPSPSPDSSVSRPIAPIHQSNPFGVPRPPLTPPPTFPISPEARLGTFIGRSLRLDRILGSGAYGTVYLATDVTGAQFAVKTLNKFNDDGSPKDQRNLAFQTREIRLHWEASSHQNVVSILHIIDDPDCIHVVLEYCPEGDLFYNIVVLGRYDGQDALIRDTFLQVLDAVNHCHSRNIYHRDLKPENVLVTDLGKTVKLADFGLASNLPHSEDYGCGSEFYMSPECLDRTTLRTSYLCAPNDVWSLGVILVNLVCRRNPWKLASPEDASYRAFTYNPGFLKTILPISDELNDILARIFTHDPAHRITLPELRKAILACSHFTNMPPPPPESVFQEDVVADMYDGPASPISDDSDDSDVDVDSDSDHIPSRNSSMDGIEPEARPDGPVLKTSQLPSAVPSPHVLTNQSVMANYSPQSQQYLHQVLPHLPNPQVVPHLQNIAPPTPPMTPPNMAFNAIPGPGPCGQPTPPMTPPNFALNAVPGQGPCGQPTPPMTPPNLALNAVPVQGPCGQFSMLQSHLFRIISCAVPQAPFSYQHPAHHPVALCGL